MLLGVQIYLVAYSLNANMLYYDRGGDALGKISCSVI